MPLCVNTVFSRIFHKTVYFYRDLPKKTRVSKNDTTRDGDDQRLVAEKWMCSVCVVLQLQRVLHTLTPFADERGGALGDDHRR